MTLERLRALCSEVEAVQRHVAGFVEERRDALLLVEPAYHRSAENLLAYVALRQLDLRELQLELGEWGLSSLGRCEGHVVASLRELRARLEDSLSVHGGSGQRSGTPLPRPTNRATAERLLREHTTALLGEPPDDRHVRILVTAADTPPTEEECARLLRAGMNAMRINTAHGDPESWRVTADTVRKVARQAGRSVTIAMDLEGPKVRTAAVGEGTAVLRYRPDKDPLGRVVRALRVPVLGQGSPPLVTAPGEPRPLRVPDAWIRGLRVGDLLRTRDARDRTREFRIAESGRGAAAAEIDRTCFLAEGNRLSWRRGGHELGNHRLEGLPLVPGSIELQLGDRFQLWLEAVKGQAGTRSPVDGRSWLVPPTLGLEHDGITLDVRPDQRVFLDDGKIEGVVERVDGQIATVRVVRAVKDRVRIRAEKGVNFPDTAITASALSPRDREILPVVLNLADVIAISFVRTPTDLREATDTILAAAGDRRPGIVVKLETAYALQSLPDMLLEAMRHRPAGLMIARGDLAVEVGFERLAELQQEILWFAEAAHLPVIWATQVLDSLARSGIPSRAEITDASMSVQAECVMLNKGPYVVDACHTLDTIIRRMEQHQLKKRNLYRPLRISLSMGGAPTPALDEVGEAT